jgi:hypothetical protein
MAEMGRPTKYNEEMLQRANTYFLSFIVPEEEKYIDVPSGKGFRKQRNPLLDEIPYIEELSLILDVDEDTITNWCKDKDNKDFFGTIKRIKTLQKTRLQRRAMTREAAAGAIFQLKVNHGMIETNRQELSGKDGKPIVFMPSEIMDKYAVSSDTGDSSQG